MIQMNYIIRICLTTKKVFNIYKPLKFMAMLLLLLSNDGINIYVLII